MLKIVLELKIDNNLITFFVVCKIYNPETGLSEEIMKIECLRTCEKYYPNRSVNGKCKSSILTHKRFVCLCYDNQGNIL